MNLFPSNVYDDNDWERFMSISPIKKKENISDEEEEEEELNVNHEELTTWQNFPITKNNRPWFDANIGLFKNELILLENENSDLPRIALKIHELDSETTIIYFAPFESKELFINIKYGNKWYILDLRKEFEGIMVSLKGPLYNYFEIDLLGLSIKKGNQYTTTKCIFAMNNKIYQFLK